MSTLTMMERTATGWKCSRCGDTREDNLLPVRAVECNCEGLGVPVAGIPDTFRHGHSVTLTADQLREHYPRKP